MNDDVDEPGEEGPGAGDGLPGRPLADAARASEAWSMLSGLLEAARLVPEHRALPDGSLPLTLLSGFLGAGKTTLLNRLLSEPDGRRLAVIVNDFGRINIDAKLVRSRTDRMISLTNGCACCTVAGDLARTLAELVGQPLPPEALLLEASGLADPRGIAQVALMNPALRLDGVLTLVDAVGFAGDRDTAAIARTLHAQLDAADLIVLTKSDEATPAQRAGARELLEREYADKPVVDAVMGDLPASVVLGIRSTRDPRGEAPIGTDHAGAFVSVALQALDPLDPKRLETFLAGLGPRVLRGKGVIRIAGDPRRFVYQRVGQRYTMVPDDPWGDEPAISSMVLVGLKEAFNAAAVRQAFGRLRDPATVNAPAPPCQPESDRESLRSETLVSRPSSPSSG